MSTDDYPSAHAVTNAAIDAVEVGTTPGPVPDLRDRPAARALVAGHSAAVAAARAYLYECTGRVWNNAVTGNASTAADIADAYAAVSHAIDVSRSAVDAMYATAGTSALYIDSPLERAHRDMHAMLRHVMAQPMWVEQAGRVKFGMGTTELLFGV